MATQRRTVTKPDGKTTTVRVGSTADTRYDASGAFKGTVGGGSKDNKITNAKVDSGALPSSQKENVPQPKTEPILITSGQGERVMNQTQDKVNTLKGAGITPEEKSSLESQLGEAQTKLNEYIAKGKDTATATTKGEDSVTYINPETDQTVTLKGSAVTEENKKKYESQGYAPSDVTTSTAETTPLDKAKSDMTASATELENLLGQLTETAITSKELAGKTRGIRQRYNARIDAMERINERRGTAMNTLGIRLGSRYTGSAGGTMGSILSEEERQGIARIVSIENDMQQAILDAEDSAREYNFGLYKELAQKAQDKYDEKKEAYKELEEAQKAEDKKIEDEAKLIEQQTSAIEQITGGEKDPMAIFTALGGVVPFDVIKGMTDTLPKADEPFTLSEGQARYDAEGNIIASRAKTYEPTTDIPGNKLLSVTEAKELGVPYGTTVGQAILLGKTPRGKVTGEQSKNLGYYLRAKDALDAIAPLEDEVRTMDIGDQIQLEYAPNLLQEKNQQIYRQAQRQFTEARLRKESGAAIPTNEYEQDNQTYFAQPGDDDATLKRKKDARAKVLESLGISSGGAYDEYFGSEYSRENPLVNWSDLSTDELLGLSPDEGFIDENGIYNE